MCEWDGPPRPTTHQMDGENKVYSRKKKKKKKDELKLIILIWRKKCLCVISWLFQRNKCFCVCLLEPKEEVKLQKKKKKKKKRKHYIVSYPKNGPGVDSDQTERIHIQTDLNLLLAHMSKCTFSNVWLIKKNTFMIFSNMPPPVLSDLVKLRDCT